MKWSEQTLLHALGVQPPPRRITFNHSVLRRVSYGSEY